MAVKHRLAVVDLVGLAGAVALVYGAWQLLPALGWMLGGGMALGAALAWTRYTPKGNGP